MARVDWGIGSIGRRRCSWTALDGDPGDTGIGHLLDRN